MAAPLTGIWRWLPAAFFACGVALIAAAVATGEADVSLVVIFPVFSGSGWMFISGVLLMIAGFVAFFLAMFSAAAYGVPDMEPRTEAGSPGRRTETRYGGVVLIGPVPIAFGSDRKTAMTMLVIGVVMAAVFIGLLIVALLLG
ncbi:MAG: DUF131 domain-containing protein [Thermoplasmata archaeon]|jgi:uncharacterized protein (TIGR00304 family)|nr:DUF131 domain-containing protein [Thermoplasmata archaeon]